MTKYWKRNFKTQNGEMAEYEHFYFSCSCFDNEISCCCKDGNKAMFSGDNIKEFIRIWYFLKEEHINQISRAA